MTGARILVIEDEAPIRRFLRVALEADGHFVTEAATAREGIKRAALEAPALVILDLGLPDAEGLSVLRTIRGWSKVPLLVLSVRADEAGKVAAFDAGAQDYVVKPFGTQELLARLRGLLRDHSTAKDAGAVLQIGDLTIDAANRQATLAAAPLKLTPKEFDLLWLLASQAGRLLTHGTILRTIWGPAHTE
ncbi:response regulator, partial [Thioclava sp. BHET1]